MLSVSPEFREALKRGRHEVVTAVKVMANGRVIDDTSLIVDLGNTTEDKMSPIRTKGDVTVVDVTGSFTPRNITDLLWPGAHELALYRGLRLLDGTVDLKPQGIFSFPDANSHYTGDKFTIQMDLFDRAQRVAEDRFEDTYVVASGTPISDAIRDIVISRLPYVEFNFTETTYTTNKVTFERGSDPWEACRALAEAAGMEVFFDRFGRCTLQPEPMMVGNPKWTYAENDEAMILEYHKKISRSQYNKWIEVGEGTEIPVPFSASAVDQLSIDITGRRQTFHVSSFYTAVEQCQAAADARKLREQGNLEQISFQQVVNPALCVGDLISMYSERLHIANRYLMEKVVTPLRHDQGQYGTVRSTLVAA